jgi:hypothetical protein
MTFDGNVKFYNKGIMRKEFVPSGKTVNGKFYCDILRRLRENIWRKCPDMAQQLLGPASRQHSGSCVAQWVAVFRVYEDELSPTLPTHQTSPPVNFSYC